VGSIRETPASTSAELRRAVIEGFRWVGDAGVENSYADLSGWWRDPALARAIAAGLADMFRVEQPTVVVGIESTGSLLGGLVAQILDVGLVVVHKSARQIVDSDPWVFATTPPDYRDRHLTLGVRRGLLRPDDRACVVDDWIVTGGQGLGTQQLVEATKATWLGMAVVVDALTDNRTRRRLGVRSLVNERQL
jgi:adenine phosphoribosyltransferase